MTTTRKTVMISSTARDLPEHRKEVMDACLSQGMFPIMMEHLPANDDEAISASLKMVDEADLYVGVFAQRYGHIPEGKKRNSKQISVTEMEYDRAVKRKIPRLIFIMDKSHPITIDDIDIENAVKLKTFKDRLQANNIVNFFKSSSDLRSHVINSLSRHFNPSPTVPKTKELPTINLEVYFNAIRKRYDVLALEGLTPPQKEEYLQIKLQSIFVEQSVRENPPPVELPKGVLERLLREKEIHPDDLPFGITLEDILRARRSYYEKPSRLVLDALTDPRFRCTIILGDPGSGKSTLARYLMLSLISSNNNVKLQNTFAGYLPLLFELRTYAGLTSDNKCESFLEYIEYLSKTEGWGITQAALNNYLKNNGRAIVIFDGLDEIFDPEQRERITRQIVGFAADYPKTHVIATSRIIGYRRKILTDAGFTHFTLQDLNEQQVETFITKWYDLAMSGHPADAQERRDRILRSFNESISIRQLAGNPMLLTIMAIIGKHQELPRERWKLYDHAASVLIQHWDVNKHLKTQNVNADFIGEDEKKEFLRRLAFQMQSETNGLAGNYVHREKLQSEFENYLKERYAQTADRAVIIARSMIDQFRERNFILSLYGANLFGFVHRAFLEYFCAFAFVWKFEKTKELTIQQLMNDVYEKHWNDQSWHEVLRLICGMVDEKWAQSIVDSLSDIKPFPPITKSRDLYMPNRGIHDKNADQEEDVETKFILAVQCLGEVRNLSIIPETAEHVLQMILDWLQIEDGPYNQGGYLRQQIIPTAKSIGANWPKREMLCDWLVKNEIKTSNENSFGKDIGTFFGLVGSGLNSMHSILIEHINDSKSSNRIISIAALATGWHSLSATLSMLHSVATNDQNPQARLVAISFLIEDFSEDQESLSLVYGLAKKDKNASIRRGILPLLNEKFPSSEQTLKLIQDCGLHDPVHIARADALILLGRNWPNHPETLALLEQAARIDPNLWLRSVSKNLINELKKNSL